MNLGNSDHCRIKNRDATSNHHLQRLNDFTRHGYWVVGAEWFRCMTTFAIDDNFKCVGRRHYRPTLGSNPASRNRRGDVQRIRCCNRRGTAVGKWWHIEQTFFEHELGTVMAFFAGLKHEQHPPWQLIFAFG